MGLKDLLLRPRKNNNGGDNAEGGDNSSTSSTGDDAQAFGDARPQTTATNASGTQTSDHSGSMASNHARQRSLTDVPSPESLLESKLTPQQIAEKEAERIAMVMQMKPEERAHAMAIAAKSAAGLGADMAHVVAAQAVANVKGVPEALVQAVLQAHEKHAEHPFSASIGRIAQPVAELSTGLLAPPSAATAMSRQTEPVIPLR